MCALAEEGYLLFVTAKAEILSTDRVHGQLHAISFGNGANAECTLARTP